jgi:RHS repeat-associated protein
VGLMVESQWDAQDDAITLTYDAHGSTRAILNAATAAVLQRLAYDAFGKTISGGGVNLTSADAALTTWLFAGDGQYDPASAFTYHLERWRNGQAFISTDPIRSYSREVHNRYLYVNANPIIYIDPSGNISLTQSLATIGISTLLGGITGYAITGSAKGAAYGAWAGAATSSAAVLILANPIKAIDASWGEDFFALAVASTAGALFGGVDYYADQLSREPDGQPGFVDASGLVTSMLEGLAKANTAFVVNYALISVLPNYSAKVQVVFNALGDNEQRALGAVVTQFTSELGAGNIFREPYWSMARIARGGLYAYFASSIVDPGKLTTIEGQLVSMVARQSEKIVIQFASLFDK